MNPLPRHLKITLLAALLLLSMEVLLQVRSHFRYGQSIFNAVANETMYVNHPDNGMLLLRPNRTIKGEKIEIQSNAEGLRNAAVSRHRPAGSVRLIMIGASSVMGAYAKTNQKTSSAFLEEELDQRAKGVDVEVINAGIAGYTVDQQRKMIEFLDGLYQPDGYIIYTGFNDFAKYCKKKKKQTQRADEGLPRLGLSGWSLVGDILIKNTTMLRPRPASSDSFIEPREVDLSEFRQSFVAQLAAVSKRGRWALVATNTKSYRVEQDLKQQMDLSATARFYNSCLDLPRLHLMYQIHNEVISEESQRAGLAVLNTDAVVPGGQQYFADASHFTEAGERHFASGLARLVDEGLLQQKGLK